MYAIAASCEPKSFDGRVLTLAKPIGDNVEVLHFREPTGADLAEAGGALFFIDDVAPAHSLYRFHTKVGAALLARLAEIPPASIDEMLAADFMGAMYQMARLLAPQ